MNALVEHWTGIRLLHPWALVLAALVPLALWVRTRRGDPVLVFAPGAFAGLGADPAPLPRTLRVRLAFLPAVLQTAALVAVVVALARPVHRAAMPVRTEGIDVLLCVDVSSSMTAADMGDRRTRLEVAKDAAAAFVRGRPHDRIGLVSFARFPDVRCPPTLDHTALLRFLADLATVESDGPEDATGIGAAVARAAQVLESAASKSKVVILLSDGEENVATAGAPGEIAPAHAAQLAEMLGVRVYAIAAGEAGAPRGSRRPIDTAPVERLATRTGGRFFAARDAEALGRVYAEIDALERAAREDPRYVLEDRFLGFVVAAILLFVGGRWLGATVFGGTP